jgi:hypothetical protein
MISRDNEGRVYPPYRLRIDRDMARAYWQGMGQAGEPDEVPPTYVIFLRGEAMGVDLFSDLSIPRRQALHGGQRYEWFAPLTWGAELDVVATVERVTEKASKTGPLWFADVVFDYTDPASGQIVVRETTRLIKRSLA